MLFPIVRLRCLEEVFALEKGSGKIFLQTNQVYHVCLFALVLTGLAAWMLHSEELMGPPGAGVGGRVWPAQKNGLKSLDRYKAFPYK
jgi:hypothetical protein